ncbi:hypothetical protein, partial [Desulfonauticus submarinus]
KLTKKLLLELKDKALAQLESYQNDPKIKQKFSTLPQVKLIPIYQIWHGWELVEMGEMKENKT